MPITNGVLLLSEVDCLPRKGFLISEGNELVNSVLERGILSMAGLRKNAFPMNEPYVAEKHGIAVILKSNG